MTFASLFVALTLPWLAPAPPQPADVPGLFNAGKHREVVAAVAGMESPDPVLIYLAAQSQQKLSNPGEAKAQFSRLAARDASDPWHHIGESGVRIVDGDVDGGLAAATEAVKLAPDLPQAHFQLGIAYGHKQDFAKAAPAFEKAAQLDPSFAYARYHAGISYYRAKRIDLMASHFEGFLRLAPEAPERPEIEAIMKTVRGRK